MTVLGPGEIPLWGGWSIHLPGRCAVERTRDGAWTAWDDARAVDVHIVEVGGHRRGRTMTPAEVLGAEPTDSGPGWIGRVEHLVEPDDVGPVFRLTVTAAAPDTLLSAWIGYRDAGDGAWAEAVRRGIRHSPG